jgi:UDP-N-acetylglucosamine--N-acetylmuramyl-(pentapeptide) pyrophosphoryl-undecaprenol N-acetylglucosamine transferase
MNGKMKRVAITGGGTGGHVFPAFAVIEALTEEKNGSEIDFFWIGSRNGMEASLVRERNIAYCAIPAGKLRRYFSLRNFSDIFLILSGFFASIVILKRHKADLLFSKGGFVSVPPVMAAFFLGIPVISHESDLDPGLATRINSRFSRILCLPYKESAASIKEAVRKKHRICITGNPVRKEILQGDPATGRALFSLPPGKPVLLVLGGSQGARQINLLIAGALEELLLHYTVVHQMGATMYTPSSRNDYVTAPFFGTELPHLLAAADLVISRAGAGTLWENGITGTPALLIPLGTGSSRGDQLRNAKLFASAGAAVILNSDTAEEPDSSDLVKTVYELGRNRGEKLEAMGKAARSLCNSDGAGQIARLVMNEIFISREE